uniref:Uncharacterized protein n=1 Tax=Anguilla anguilla TaxID=7936 RepID=A0A0E9XE41_ANGAN
MNLGCRSGSSFLRSSREISSYSSSRITICFSLSIFMRMAALLVSLRKRNLFSFSFRVSSTSHTTSESDILWGDVHVPFRYKATD